VKKDVEFESSFYAVDHLMICFENEILK